MVGSFAVAYSAPLAQISRVRVVAPRSGEARDSRSGHDLHASHESAGKIDMCTVVPYVCNSSQDVENGSLDLVLSSSTRTKAVQAIVIASKERQKSLQDPLLPALSPMFSVSPVLRSVPSAVPPTAVGACIRHRLGPQYRSLMRFCAAAALITTQ